MSLRNMDPSIGLCNGTRLIVNDVTNGKILRATIAGSDRIVLIPRIKLRPPNDATYPFKWYRKQFPVRLAFAMTINKSQGQTFKSVGVDLFTKPVFSHGQLYVAASRVGNPANIRILVPEGNLTRNVVYTEALIHEN